MLCSENPKIQNNAPYNRLDARQSSFLNSIEAPQFHCLLTRWVNESAWASLLDQGYGLRTRRWSWPRTWRGNLSYARDAIHRPVDTDVIRVDSFRPAIFDKIPESKPACSPRWDTVDVDRELRPCFGVSAHCVGRVDIQQEISEIADIERGCPYVSACAIGTHPNLQPIRKRIAGAADAGQHTHCRQWGRRLHCTCVERHGTAVLQAYFRH
jgi:hypothetical protein